MAEIKAGTDFDRQERMKKSYGDEYYANPDFDMDASFQKYRTGNVLAIYNPGPGEKVADFGCGWGVFSLVLAPRVGEVVGVDYSDKSIEVCNERLKSYGYRNVRFVKASIAETGLPAGYFDTVVCADIMEHLYPDVFYATLDECKRVLKPGGRVSIWTDYGNNIFTLMRERNFILKKDESHVHYKTMEMMTKGLEERGFEINKAYYVQSHLPFWGAIESLIMGFIPIFRRRIAILATLKTGA